MTPAEYVARARSAIGLGIGYELGAGGLHPAASHPGEKSRRGKLGKWCDCSAFVAWVYGYARVGWHNTDAIVHDSKHPGGLFTLVPAMKVQAGDCVVYGGIFEGLIRTAIGHTGIVTRPPVCEHCGTALHAHDPHCPEPGARLGSEAWWAALRVVHCSSSNWRHTGDAIRETRGLGFKKARTIFARFNE